MIALSAIQRWLLMSLMPVALGSCCQLDEQKHECSKASDCLIPYVCCTNPKYTLDDSPHTCVPRTRCEEYIPFLNEANPCHRKEPLKDPCREPLACCDGTLTCRTTDSCPPIVPSPDNLHSSNKSCAGDPDCADGMVCCGIDIDDRSGQCKTLSDCRAQVGIEEPIPDAGVEGGMDADAADTKLDAEAGAEAQPDADAAD